ncbi:hypothetical protein ABL78_2449 [Leptomonas seymouri]|uniref:Transmembrane protein n=1 Tax=Leptomonas seymouri TaxID=5684 RepID=A0A0N0P763_LEPSE|nr:hypothetical protein ABL78_2449 [Leptomonas seymouri]|eukprot:KPI88436.1 hypothetical protein ABL78_2449 [Leptomonas seymouri]
MAVLMRTSRDSVCPLCSPPFPPFLYLLVASPPSISCSRHSLSTIPNTHRSRKEYRGGSYFFCVLDYLPLRSVIFAEVKEKLRCHKHANDRIKLKSKEMQSALCIIVSLFRVDACILPLIVFLLRQAQSHFFLLPRASLSLSLYIYISIYLYAYACLFIYSVNLLPFCVVLSRVSQQ